MKNENISFPKKIHKKLNANMITADENIEIDSTNPFFNKSVCFTGKMDSLKREDGMKIIANLGGIPQNGVNSQTNYLILGEVAYISNVKNGVTGKMKKAYELIEKGNDLMVISESLFFDMIEEFTK